MVGGDGGGWWWWLQLMMFVDALTTIKYYYFQIEPSWCILLIYLLLATSPYSAVVYALAIMIR